MATEPTLPAMAVFTIADIHIRAESTKGGPLRFELTSRDGRWNTAIGRSNRLFPVFCHLLYDHLRKAAAVTAAANDVAQMFKRLAARLETLDTPPVSDPDTDQGWDLALDAVRVILGEEMRELQGSGAVS